MLPLSPQHPETFMLSFRRTLFALLIVGLPTAFVTSPGAAQTWPGRPVTLVVPFAAGGSTDGVARVIAKELGDRFGQQFIVENRGGAAGNLAAAAVAKAQPDGYTLLLTTTGPAAVNKLLYKSLSFDPSRDFAPIVMIGITPQAIVVSPKMQVDTLKDLVARAKASAEKLTFGNSGVGTMAHITAVSLARATGLQVTHVTYRGGAQAMTDVIGGQIDVAFPAYVPNLGGLKVLALTSTERMHSLPDVPTVRETGVADIVAGTWFGIVAPAGAPADIVRKINAATNDFLKSKHAIELFDELGIQPIGGTPESMQAFVADETARWEPIIRSAHISLE
jgi:tripartite-type tricarboxylate transporter receptor subunit TctC